MIAKTLSALLFIFLFHQSHSQDHHYVNGKKSFDEGEYHEALKSLNEALDNKYLMSGKFVPRAYNFRAKAIAKHFDEFLSHSDPTFISENPNILIDAFEDLDQAILFDDGKCTPLINETKAELLDVTFRFSKTIADSLRIDRGSNDPQTDSLIHLIIDELLILKKLQNDSYAINDLLGLLEYKSGEMEKALAFFNLSEELYAASTPEKADFKHTFNYYYQALINYQDRHDFPLALEKVKVARNVISKNFETEESKELDGKLEALEFQIKLLLE